MRRRKFISLLGGVAAVAPLAARAQQRERMRRIGVLLFGAADDPVWQARIGGFLQGLQETMSSPQRPKCSKETFKWRPTRISMPTRPSTIGRI